jgi:hypothetical protein
LVFKLFTIVKCAVPLSFNKILKQKMEENGMVSNFLNFISRKAFGRKKKYKLPVLVSHSVIKLYMKMAHFFSGSLNFM